MITRSKLFLTILTVLFMTVLLAGTAFAQSVALEVEPADEAAEGEQVTLTADAEDFDNPEYRFAYRVSGKTKIYTPQTGTDNSWTITIPAGAAGTYDLGVQVREAGTSGWSSPPVHDIVFGYVITEEAAPPPPPPGDLEIVSVVAISPNTLEVTTTTVPDDVTVNAEDFRVYVNAAVRSINSYTAVDATTHHLELAPPPLAVGDVIRVVGRQDVGGEFTFTIPAQTDIVEVADLDDEIFAVGTSLSVVIPNLPTSVQVTLQDGTVQTLGIENWSSATYNANVPGTYEFTGDLVLTGGVTNTNDLQARVNVVVSDRVVTGIISAVTPVSIEFNNDPAQTYQVATPATEILLYLGNANTRGALVGTTGTVFLNENDRIIRMLKVRLAAGNTSEDDFSDIAQVNAPPNMIIEGRPGSSVVNVTGGNDAIIAGNRLTVRNIAFNLAGDDLVISGNDNTFFDSSIAPGTADLVIDANRNTVDNVQVAGDLLIAVTAAVNGLDVINSDIAGNVDLCNGAFTSRNLNFTGGSFGAAAVTALSTSQGATANSVTDVTIDGTAIGTVTPGTQTNVDVAGTNGLTIRNTSIFSTNFNDTQGNSRNLTLENIPALFAAAETFPTNSPRGMDIDNVSFRNIVNIQNHDVNVTDSEFRAAVNIFDGAADIRNIAIETSEFQNNVTVGTGAQDVENLVFDSCTFNNQMNAIQTINFSPGGQVSPVTIRGTTTVMSADANRVQINSVNAARRTVLEGTIDGGNRLNLNSTFGITGFDFRAGLVVNDTRFANNISVNGNAVTLNNCNTLDPIALTLLGQNISVTGGNYAGDFNVGDGTGQTGRGTTFNATNFEVAVGGGQRTLLVNVSAEGTVFNSCSFSTNNNNFYRIFSNAPDTEFNVTTFNATQQDINVSGPVVVGNVGTMTFNGFTPHGPNDVNETNRANALVAPGTTGVVWNP